MPTLVIREHVVREYEISEEDYALLKDRPWRTTEVAARSKFIDEKILDWETTLHA